MAQGHITPYSDITYGGATENPDLPSIFDHTIIDGQGREHVISTDDTESDVLDLLQNWSPEKLANTNLYQSWDEEFKKYAAGGDRGKYKRIVAPIIRSLPARTVGGIADAAALAQYTSRYADPFSAAARAYRGVTGEKVQALEDWDEAMAIRGERLREEWGAEALASDWQDLWINADQWLVEQGHEPYLQEYLGTAMSPDARTRFERMISLATEIGLTAPAEALTGAGVLKTGATALIAASKLASSTVGMKPAAVKAMADAAQSGQATNKLIQNPDKFSRWLSDSVDAYTTFTRADPVTGAKRFSFASPAIRSLGAESAFGFTAGGISQGAMEWVNSVNPNAAPWVTSLTGIGAAIFGPPTLAVGFTGLVNTPGVRFIQKVLDPYIAPGRSAARYLSGLRAFSNKRGDKMATIHELLTHAFKEGGFEDAAAGLAFTTPEVLRTQALRLDGENLLMEESLSDLAERLRSGEIDDKTYNKARSEIAKRKYNNDEKIVLARTYANFTESILASAYKDPDLMAEFFTKEGRRLHERREAVFKHIIKEFDSDVRSINFGGREGGSPVELNEDYLRSINEGVDPVYESTRKKLASEGNPLGSQASEMSFLNAGTRERLNTALDKRTNAQQKLVDESVESAERRIEVFQKGLKRLLSDRGLRSVEDMTDLERKLVGQFIRDTYDDVHREFRAFSSGLWDNVAGIKTPTTRENLIFPEGARDSRGNDISGQTAEEYAANRVKWIADNRTDLTYEGLVPGPLRQVAGQQAIVDIIKTAEETGIAPRDRAKLETLENRKIAAEQKVEEAQRVLDNQLRADAEKHLELRRDLETYINHFDTAYANRANVEGTNLLRYFVNDPEINWETMTKADLDTYLDALVRKFDGVEVRDRRTNDYSNLVSVIGEKAAQDVSAGTYSPAHAIGVQLGALRSKPSKYQKTIANPFENILLKQKAILEVRGPGNEYGASALKLDAKLEALEVKAKTATTNLEEAVQKYIGADKKNIPEGAEVDAEDLVEAPVIGRLTTTDERNITPENVRAIISHFTDAIRREGSRPNPNNRKLAALAEERQVIQQLLDEVNFPDLDLRATSDALAGTELLRRVENKQREILRRKAGGEKLEVPDLRSKVLPERRGTLGDVDTASVDKQMAALAAAKLSTMQFPRDWVTFNTVTDPGSGRPELVASFNNELFDNIADGKTFLDLPDSPFERISTGTRGLSDWSLGLKPGASTSPAGLDVVEAALLEALFIKFNNPDFVTETGLQQFYQNYKGAFDLLEKEGRKVIVENFQDARSAEIYVSELKTAVRESDRKKLNQLKEQASKQAVEDPLRGLDVDDLLDFKDTERQRLANERALVQTIGPVFEGPQGGFSGPKFIDSILVSDNASHTTKQALHAVGEKQILEGRLGDEFQVNPARDGFESSIVAALFEKSLVDSEIASRQLGGGGKAKIFDPIQWQALIDNPKIQAMLRETFPENEALIEGLQKMSEGLSDVTPFTKGAKPLAREDINEFVQEEMWTNLGRVIGLWGAKQTNFVNELYAAGTGARIFRRIGKNVTGTVVKNMVLEAALNPDLARAFSKDAASIDSLRGLFRKYAAENLNVPRAIINRAQHTPFAFMNLITSSEQGMGFIAPPVETEVPEGYEFREGPSGPGFYPKISSISPTTTSPTLASASGSYPGVPSVINRINPLSPIETQGAPRQYAATSAPPDNRGQMLQDMDAMGLDLFTASKGGLASLKKKKKPKQMVY